MNVGFFKIVVAVDTAENGFDEVGISFQLRKTCCIYVSVILLKMFF